MKILLACSAGMSTSLLEESMKKYMAENGIEGSVEAHGIGPAKTMLQDWDICLLGPQVRFQLSGMQQIANQHNVPVAVIPGQFYALANGEEVFKFAKEEIAKNK